MFACRARRIAFFLALVIGAGCAGAESSDILGSLEERLVSAHEAFAKAVVRVKAVTEELDASGKPTRWVSSGFFIDREGRVVTNLATTAAPSRVWIEQNGLPYLAELVGFDPITDLALLQLVKLPERFGVIPIEDAAKKLPVGSLALAITSPLEFDPTPFLGLVAGYESYFTSFRFPFTYMRVTIPAGPGENGSPVLSLHGKLAGISVASLPDVRSSYLVPARALARIVADLSALGRVAYSDLPIDFVEKPDAANLNRQVVVAGVKPDSSAARADVRTGDIVRLLGTDPVRTIHDVRDALFYARPGEFISLEVEREGRRIPFALPLEEKAFITPKSVSDDESGEHQATPAEESLPEGLSRPTRPTTG